MNTRAGIGQVPGRLVIGALSAVVVACLLLLARGASAQAPSGANLPSHPLLTPTPTPTCAPQWQIVTSPNVGAGSNYLTSVSAVSESDVWAVGWYTGTGMARTLTEHWDGTSWSVVSSPNPGSTFDYLFSVTAIFANDAWAVGNSSSGALTIHWDGTSWTTIANPLSPGILTGVTAISSTDVWAVGNAPQNQLKTMHWDGTAWSIVPCPSPGFNYTNSLYGVSAISTNDVWTVGFFRHFSPQGLTMHWDGTAWSEVTSPYNPAINSFQAVDGVASNDVWAVGGLISQSPPPSVLFHWDGTVWNNVAVPNVGLLNSVTALASNDVWAVGVSGIVHWDGIAWGIVSSPNVGVLKGVSAISANNVWAVGSYNNGGVDNTLIEHYSDPCVTGTNTPTATPTSTATPTITPTPSITPTCTPTLAWTLVNSPNPGSSDNYLMGLVATVPSDVWVVGYYRNGSTSPSQTLVEHWNGTQWSVLPSPNVGTGNNQLYSIADVPGPARWAVGSYRAASGFDQTLILYWDGSAWSVVSSPNMGTNNNVLYSVSATLANDVWAVGSYYDSGLATNQTLIEHWNGSAWSVVPSPNASASYNVLKGVNAGQNTVPWAVGYYNAGGGSPDQTLAMTWNGTSWNIVSTPNAPTGFSVLTSVAAIEPNDIWAVGYNTNPPGGQVKTLTMHSDGTTWSLLTSPNPGTVSNFLYGVSVSPIGQPWAVGTQDSGSGSRTLVMRYDFTNWTVMNSPNAGTSGNYPQAVVAVSSAEAWMAGYSGPAGASQTLIEHYTTVQCATPTATPTLTATSSSTRTFTVTTVSTPTSTPPNATLTYTATPTPACGAHNFTSTDVPRSICDLCTITSTVTVAGVGIAADVDVTGLSSTGSDLILRLISPSGTSVSLIDRSCANLVNLTLDDEATGSFVCPPAPNGIYRPASPLSVFDGQPADGVWQLMVTDNAPGDVSVLQAWGLRITSAGGCGTSTPTATPCTITFTDVHPTDYFYTPVSYLYCHHVISGYADGTFRPYNNTTRGQLTKIVVLAEEWTIYTPPTPTFRDVPTTHAFYSYIETAYNHGIISGYSCGSGCLEFRPDNNVTRAQLCKIIVLAQNWPDYTPPVPTFRDVPASDPFYVFIETAYAHNIISGYTCSTNCLEFRPSNNATRGQICKIVYLAVTQP